MIEYLSQPWSWYFSGFMVVVVMFLLLYSGGKFGVSSNLRSMCSIVGAGKNIPFFDFDWKSQVWNLVFIGGSIVGGFIAHTYLSSDEAIQISQSTIADLDTLGIEYDSHLAPAQFFTWEGLTTLPGFLMMVVGGFLVGFGARWAGGCTSGHGISGLSNLQLPSLIAVIGFFIGGLIMTHLIYPLIFKSL